MLYSHLKVRCDKLKMCILNLRTPIKNKTGIANKSIVEIK